MQLSYAPSRGFIAEVCLEPGGIRGRELAAKPGVLA